MCENSRQRVIHITIAVAMIFLESRESRNPCKRLDSRFRGGDTVVLVTRDFPFQIKHLFPAGHSDPVAPRMLSEICCDTKGR